MAWFLFFIASTSCVCFAVVWGINFVSLKKTTKQLEELEAVFPAKEKQYAVMFERAEKELDIRKAESIEQSDRVVAAANQRGGEIVLEARQRAGEIEFEARKISKKADLYQSTVISMKNIIDGYGDEYLIPSSGLIEDLAEEFEHKEAGQQLKIARKQTKLLIKTNMAAKCEYVEDNRREGAENFVLDAFNGKVDSILSKVKHDNAGKLKQAIHDAFVLVNYGGKAFRNARITEEYYQARQDELKWAAIAQELKLLEREEQRRIREQIREEEKARREYERAVKEAVKEEDVLKKAMAKAESKMRAASDEQRAEYELQLAELQDKLLAAEDKNKRAVSMAQMTRRGHVYIISNIGSFGEDVFKIGLTRRLEPLDRVKELGDSSVPFTFDVHAMILSDDAPALENRLHKHFVMSQVNKVNHRKEFFRAKLSDIRHEIEKELGMEVKWTMASEAREYRETLAIERLIESDPSVSESWRNRQLTLDPTDIKDFMNGAIA